MKLFMIMIIVLVCELAYGDFIVTDATRAVPVSVDTGTKRTN